MKIGIDARFYGPRTGGGGIGRYVSQLVDHLQLIDDRNEYILFLRRENFHECVIHNPRFYKRLVDVPWYTLREQHRLPREIKLAGVDFMHYPHWNVPIFCHCPFLVTIHDLILLEDPTSARSTTKNALVHGFKYAGFRTVLETAVHRSRQILTVSKFTKHSILEHFRVSPKKISVTPNGVLAPRAVEKINLSDLGVYEPYFLYVGNAYPHKNLEMMLHAFSRFVRQHRYTQMVVAGRRDIFSRRLEQEAAEINIPHENIRFIDLPSDDELAALYARARLFIFPSRIEGFGLPPLEAMSYGTPTAVAKTSSLPEVCGEAAYYFGPDDIEKLEQIMNLAAEHPEKLIDKIALGLDQVKKFTWQRTAELTLDAYQNFRSR